MEAWQERAAPFLFAFAAGSLARQPVAPHFHLPACTVEQGACDDGYSLVSLLAAALVGAVGGAVATAWGWLRWRRTALASPAPARRDGAASEGPRGAVPADKW